MKDFVFSVIIFWSVILFVLLVETCVLKAQVFTNEFRVEKNRSHGFESRLVYESGDGELLKLYIDEHILKIPKPPNSEYLVRTKIDSDVSNFNDEVLQVSKKGRNFILADVVVFKSKSIPLNFYVHTDKNNKKTYNKEFILDVARSLKKNTETIEAASEEILHANSDLKTSIDISLLSLDLVTENYVIFSQLILLPNSKNPLVQSCSLLLYRGRIINFYCTSSVQSIDVNRKEMKKWLEKINLFNFR